MEEQEKGRLKGSFWGSRELAQRLRVLAALQRTRVPFPASSWQFTIFCYSNFRGSSALFWHLWTAALVVYRGACWQNIHTHKIKALKKKSFCPEERLPHQPVA